MITNKYWNIEKTWNYWLDLQRSNGPAWVNEVLAKDLENVPELESARIFIKKVI